MSKIFPDKKTLDLGNKKIKGKSSDDNIKTNFSTMMIDFKVIQYVVGFSIAVAFREFLTRLLDTILVNKLNIRSDLLVSFLVLISMCIVLYLLIFHVFYKYIYTSKEVKSQIFQQALTEKKKEEVKKDIEEDKETKKHVEKDIELNSEIIESFYSNYINK